MKSSWNKKKADEITNQHISVTDMNEILKKLVLIENDVYKFTLKYYPDQMI